MFSIKKLMTGFESRPLCQLSYNQWPVSTLLFVGHPRPLFNLFLYFQTNITIFTTNKCEKMSMQYMVMGYKPTTFGK